MSTRTALAFLLVQALTVGPRFVERTPDKLARMPGARLLVGRPPVSLTITNGDIQSTLQREVGDYGDWYVTPSISVDGRVVASARIDDTVPLSTTARPTLVVETYSMAERSWTRHPAMTMLAGAVSLSADGVRLACLCSDGRRTRLQVMDLPDQKMRREIEIDGRQDSGPDHVSLSPDGRHVVFDATFERGHGMIPSIKRIQELDVENGTVQTLAEGASPAWSPSGEWIAFFDYEPGRDKDGWYAVNANRISIIRPDGTSYKTLVTFHAHEALSVPPAWSPDSRALLINRWRDVDDVSMNIYLLELASGKLTQKFANTAPVFAWVTGN